MPKRIARKSTSAAQPGPAAIHSDAFLVLLNEADDDAPAMRGALVVAVVVHVVLLLITFPSLTSEPLEAADAPTAIRLSPTPPMRVVEEHTETLPPRREHVATIPMPDLTPDDTEWVASEDLTSVFDSDLPELGLALPDAPPAPEESQPPVRVSSELVRPVKIHHVEPRYTEMARRARIEGAVIIRTVIDQQGRIGQAVVLRGLPLGLGDAALNAVKQWRFEPPTLDGQPVEVAYVVTINFRLN